MNDDKVLARVGDVDITEADVRRLKLALGDQAVQFEGTEGAERLLDELIRQELLYCEAKRRHWDRDEAFREVMAQVERQQLQQFALSRLLSEAEVSRDEVEAYYEAHEDRFSLEEKRDPAALKARIYQQLMLLRQQALYVNLTRQWEREYHVTREPLESDTKGE